MFCCGYSISLWDLQITAFCFWLNFTESQLFWCCCHKITVDLQNEKHDQAKQTPLRCFHWAGCVIQVPAMRITWKHANKAQSHEPHPKLHPRRRPQILRLRFWEQGSFEPSRIWSRSCCVGLLYFSRSQHNGVAVLPPESRKLKIQIAGISAGWSPSRLLAAATITRDHKTVMTPFWSDLSLRSCWVECFEM